MQPELFAKTSDEIGSGSDALERYIQQATKTEADLTKEIENAQTKRSEVRKLKKFLDDLDHYRKKDWCAHIKQHCERERDFLSGLRKQSHPSFSTIEGLYRDAKTRTDVLVKTLPSRIDQLAQEVGLPLDRSRSRHPRYYFGKYGFVEAQVNDNRQMARISTREGRLDEIPADAQAIIMVVQNEVKRLFERKFSDRRFLRDLYSAYKEVLKTAKAREGDPTRIRDVFDTMTNRKQYRKYRKDEFLVDLSRLVEKGLGATGGYQFDLQQTKDTESGMLLLGAAGQGMVNLLTFRKQEPNTP